MKEEERLREFEDRIAGGEKIEPGDWMPEGYRKQLIRMIAAPGLWDYCFRGG